MIIVHFTNLSNRFIAQLNEIVNVKKRIGRMPEDDLLKKIRGN